MGNDIKKRIQSTWSFPCFLLMALSLASASCSDDIPATGTSILTVSIQKDTVNSMEPAISVLFNCISSKGKKFQLTAVENAEGRFEATVPADCQPDKRFIVIRVNSEAYCFETDNAGFEAGRRYDYVFRMSGNRPEPIAGTGIEVEDWHIINIDVVIS